MPGPYPGGTRREREVDLEARVDVLDSAPVDVTGARDAPEEALANLLAALEELGLITDSTTAT